MPELPEVETIRLGLAKKLIGLKVKTIQVLNPKSFQGDPSQLVGKKVLTLDRKAKVLIINFEGDLSILFHLKMSGQLIFESGVKNQEARIVGGHPTKDMAGQMPIKSTRVIFEFEDDSKLFFNDQRKFGWVKLVKTDQVKEDSLISKLGPEIWDTGFDWEKFKINLLKHKKSPIKAVILDQTVLSGLGNIYACESLFIAKIHPNKKVIELSDDEFKNLFKGVKQSLEDGIKHGGSSHQHYVNSEGTRGYFLDHAFTYDRKGLECKICQTPIQKIKLGGRGTYFCPNCQL